MYFGVHLCYAWKMIEGKFLTVSEVAKLLQVHQRTVLRNIQNNKLRAVKIGRAFRITSTALQKFVDENSTGDKK